jgi:hypothetical protein
VLGVSPLTFSCAKAQAARDDRVDIMGAACKEASATGDGRKWKEEAATAPPHYQTWRDAQKTEETKAQKRARYLHLYPRAGARYRKESSFIEMICAKQKVKQTKNEGRKKNEVQAPASDPEANTVAASTALHVSGIEQEKCMEEEQSARYLFFYVKRLASHDSYCRT